MTYDRCSRDIISMTVRFDGHEYKGCDISTTLLTREPVSIQNDKSGIEISPS